MVISGVPGSLSRWAAARTLYARIPERAAITTERRERAAVRPRPARQHAWETSASGGGDGGAPRAARPPPNPAAPPPPHPDAGDELFPFWERQDTSFPDAGGDPTASCCCRRERLVLPAHPTRGGLGRGCACERQHQQQIFLAQKTCNAAARGAGVGANAKQRRRQQQQQPEFLPPPPPPPREAAERLQLHLQQQPASPPPGAPLDLGREQPRQQLETKINSPHPKLLAQRAEAQPEPSSPAPRRPSPRRGLRGLPCPERPEACVPVCPCPRVDARVRLGHPASAASSYGRVCPAGPAPRPRVPGAAAPSARRARSPRGSTALLTRRAGRLRRDCGSAARHTPLPHPSPLRQDLKESSASGAPPSSHCRGGRRRRRRRHSGEPSGAALGEAPLSQHPASRGPELI